MYINLSKHHNMINSSVISMEPFRLTSILTKNVLSFFTAWHGFCINHAGE
ncbi:hypothetical protein BMS3Bbin07_00513 [bacterium BMS3Bbin07]|uniref:Uncharacterized protein n=1 Tax=hydrothermal vent metagenome TaxID=652676 RepID=A0A3B1D693_9ZZZZ|nr:hypothetical protein BMS3Bbin07_00513 [bacterium BMS3Bbin07]